MDNPKRDVVLYVCSLNVLTAFCQFEYKGSMNAIISSGSGAASNGKGNYCSVYAKSVRQSDITDRKSSGLTHLQDQSARMIDRNKVC